LLNRQVILERRLALSMNAQPSSLEITGTLHCEESDGEPAASWTAHFVAKLLLAAEDVVGFDGGWVDTGPLPPGHSLVGRMTFGALRIPLVAARLEKPDTEVIGVLSAVTVTGDTRFVAPRGAYVWLPTGESVPFERAIRGELEVERSAVSDAVSDAGDYRMNAEQRADDRWVFRFDGISLWGIDGASLELELSNQAGSTFAMLMIQGPELAEGLVRNGPAGLEVREPEPGSSLDPFGTEVRQPQLGLLGVDARQPELPSPLALFIDERVGDDVPLRGRVLDFVRAAEDKRLEIDIGRSTSSPDGLANYAIVRAGPEQVAILWPGPGRVDLRLPAEVGLRFKHAERRRGRANAYQLQVYLRDDKSVREAIELLGIVIEGKAKPAVRDRANEAPSADVSQLQAALLTAARRAKAEAGYNPTYFLQMLADRGALETARALIASPRPSDGFVRLLELGRLDLSVEAIACRREYRHLFSTAELATAKRRLHDAGYEV
jgi:hypothetical protein